MTSPESLNNDTVYHIFTHGVNRENIFREERNYVYFWNLFEKHVQPVVKTFAYCLLKNHFHLLVRTRSVDELNQTLRVSETLRVLTTNPSTGFSNFLNAYAKGINKTYGRTGSLFQHPFGRVVITDDAQFAATARYIHQNPQKHGFVSDFRDWPYSSYNILLNDQPTFIERETVLDCFGGRDAFVGVHTEWMKEARNEIFGGDDC